MPDAVAASNKKRAEKARLSSSAKGPQIRIGIRM
jgi:hypothetical protein